MRKRLIPKRGGPFTADEEQAVLNHFATHKTRRHDYPFVYTLLNTGARFFPSLATLGQDNPAKLTGIVFHPDRVNSKGMVVGDITSDSDTSDSHAAMWADGVLTPVPERPGTTLSDAVSINESGRIVGLEYHQGPNDVHAVLWDRITTPVQIGPLISTVIDFSQAEDVDAARDVVGSTLANNPPVRHHKLDDSCHTTLDNIVTAARALLMPLLR